MTNLKPLPTSIDDFKTIRKENYLYVDKTKYLYSLLKNKGSKYFFRRPRRFGKSLTISTLEAILLGHKELFDGLWIYDKLDWKPFYVVRFDFFEIVSFENKKELEHKIKKMIIEIGKSNGVLLPHSESWDDNLKALLSELKAKGPVAILIDEYDSPFHKSLDWKEELQNVTKQTFRDFYGILKTRSSFYDFLFVTGITKIAKTSVFSGMNMLEDISIEPQYAGLCGITQAELESYFSEHIDHMAAHQNRTREEILALLKKMYNGYCFSPDSPIHVYNPFSLNLALKSMKMRKFWFQTGTPSLLINLIKNNDYTLSFMNDLKLSEDEVTASYDFSTMPIKNILYQTGYLTIETPSKNEINPQTQNATSFSLTFPNEEVRIAFASALLQSFRGKETTDEEINYGEKLVEALKNGLWKDYADIWNLILAHIPYNLHVSIESYYHSLFVLFFTLFGFEAIAERKTSIGRIDSVIELVDKIYIIEFKLNKPASDALDQIKNRRYFEVYLHKHKPIFFIGVSFDSKIKQISELLVEDLQSNTIQKIL